jgi:thiol-disulfide isomerase/thioredoxin
MRNKFIALTLTIIFYFSVNAQTLYSERFNTLTLNTGTYSSSGSIQTYLYKDVPSTMFIINNGLKTADTLSGNYPFRANGQKLKAFLSYKQANQADTFAVSTSWLKPTGVTDAWLITPTINSIAANSVLMWDAMSPDATNLDGYEVYITTNTSTTAVVGDFSAANKVFTISAEKNTWQTRGVSLAAYAGQSIRVAFRNNSTDKYQLWIDDIIVKNITNGYDASTIINNTYKYSTVGISNIISATFKNSGFTPITSLQINYKVGSNPTVTETQSLVSPLSYLDSKQLNFSVPYITSTPAYNSLKVWVTLINGFADQQTSNDTISGSLIISSSLPPKKVLVESFTGSWCGWCPDGQLKLADVALTNTNVVVASFHNDDNMSTVSGENLMTDYATVFPSATIDQYLLPGNSEVAVERNNWNTYISQRQAMLVPASVSLTAINYNASTRVITASVSSSFLADVKGDYRLNLYIKENNVFGAIADSLLDNDWNQYSFLYNIPSSPYYQYGNYLNPTTFIMGSNRYKHQYVIDTMLSGSYGVSGIIPLSGSTIGQTYTKPYTYTLTLPTGTEYRYNEDNIYLIGVLTEFDIDSKKRAVINVAEKKLTPSPEVVGIKEQPKKDVYLNIFPNPTTSVCYLNYDLTKESEVTVSVFNMLGELIYSEVSYKNAGNVSHELSINNLMQGNYSVEVLINGFKTVKKLTVIK